MPAWFPGALIVFAATLLVRLPTFFEPPWHTDEGIFAAVGHAVASGGTLYADAWESKPPLFLYLYAGLTEVFGPGVLPLRLASTAAAAGAAVALYVIGRSFMTPRRATAGALLFVLLTGTPFWEGNLALTETFALLPTALAVLCVIQAEKRDWPAKLLVVAGVLFGVAFLIRQPTAIAAAGIVLWLLLTSGPWLRAGVLMAAGSALAILVAIVGFIAAGSFAWFWDANVTFFFSYVSSGREIPLYYRPLAVLPALAAAFAVFSAGRHGERPAWSLPVIWLTFALAATLLTGRPYSHYFLPVFPPLALVIAMFWPSGIGFPRQARRLAPVFVSIVLLWVLVVTPEFGGNALAMHYTKGPAYYVNFAQRLAGTKTLEQYNDYFDKRVNRTNRLALTLERLGAAGSRVYVWGEYPWLYPMADTRPATRYMTSFYVLLIPRLDADLGATLKKDPPKFIVVFEDAWPCFSDPDGIMWQRFSNASRTLNELIQADYELVTTEMRARIYRRVGPDATASAGAGPALQDVLRTDHCSNRG